MKKFIFLFLLTLLIMPVMAYSTDADLYERMDQELVIQLTDDDNTGAIDQTVLSDKRETAHEMVNAHLRGRYTLPFGDPPKVLANIEADLLVSSLYSRRPNIEKPEAIRDAEKDAFKLLKDIAQGTIQLKDIQRNDTSEPGFYKTNKNKRKFGDDRLKKF